MVDITKLFMSGSKVLETNDNDNNSNGEVFKSQKEQKHQKGSTSTSSRRPRIPILVKYSCWGLWTILVLYLLYKQENMNYVLFVGRIVWLLVLFVSLRDGTIHLSSVEYNVQSKSLVGMISSFASLWILTNQIRFFYNTDHDHNDGTNNNVLPPEYYALGILAGYQSFESPFGILYCRPTPIKVTKWNVIEDYIALPIFLAMMLAVEEENNPIVSLPLFRIIITAISMYRFIRVYLEYQYVTTITSETIPLKHQFTATLDSTVKSTDTPIINRWRIYGNTYDMTKYIEHHPGGVEAIMLGANRDDCTALFQSYHPFNIRSAKAVLEKYRIADPSVTTTATAATATAATTTNSSGVDKSKNSNETKNGNNDNNITATTTKNAALVSSRHENDLFYDVLCQRVSKVLKDANIDPIKDRIPTNARYGYYMFLMVAVITSCMAHCKGSLVGSFLFGVFGWLLGAIGHDGGHYAVSRYPIVNDFAVWGMSLLCNPIMWQHQHTYAHHCYTNEFDRDPDLHHFDMFLRYHKRYIPHPVYKNQTSRLFVIFAYAFTCFGQCYWIPIRFIQERSLYGTVTWTDRNRFIRLALLFVHFLAYSVIVMFVPFFVHKSTIVAMIASLLPMGVSGILFAFCSQVGHITEMCTNDKFNATTQSKRHIDAQQSWAAGQIETTNDFCPQSLVWHILANGLTLQVEHHLFPGLNHCHLRRIQPIVEQTCIEYNVNYKKYNTWMDVMDATFIYLNKLALE